MQAPARRAPLERLQGYKKRMGWSFPWVSSARTDFNADFGLTTEKDEKYGLSVFIRDDDNNVYRTYFTKGFPARAFIGVGSLLAGGRFEVQGTAVKQ